MKNYSSRREAVRRALASTKTHPTAANVYDMVRADMPGISLGTVYRNLSQMANEGEILRLTTGGGVERYDATAANHYHLSCTECGAVSDLDLPPLDELDSLCEQSSGAMVRRHSLIFYGVCADCRKRNES